MSWLDCCLWLNRKKISNAAEIIDNFDLAAIRGYFLGGSLSEWLREHNGAIYADMLDDLDPQDIHFNDKLAAVFGKSAGDINELFCGAPQEDCGQCGSFVARTPDGSFKPGSGWAYFGGFGSFPSHGSFGNSGSYGGLGSFGVLGSFNKFRLWEWEWEWRFGGNLGSFRRGSFSFGSYQFGSGSYLLEVFQRLGSFSGSWGFGSYSGIPGSFGGSWAGFSGDEYARIMYECLKKCPLNCFGYGIHIV